MQYTAAVLGHFGEGHILLNGQTVKTKIITDEVQRQLGTDQVLKIDTHGGWKTLLKAPFQVFRALRKSRNVLLFPAHNGLRVYAPLLWLQRRFFQGRRIHYVVIGGWLPQFSADRPWLARMLRTFDGIYVETKTMYTALEKQGYTNLHVLPNCKDLTVLTEQELVYPDAAPYRLCTFSRVMREKGIEDAVDAVRTVNERLGYTAYTLDIYGQVDAAQTQWFDELQTSFPDYVRYAGCVDAHQSVAVLQSYFALLFPTRFYTEGIPGTIIDAYAAGVPVISARWASFADIVEEGRTGWGYTFECREELEAVLLQAAQTPQVLLKLKENCIRKALDYIPSTAVSVLTDCLV